MSAFSADNKNLYVILGIMNTPISNYVFKMLNPTINLQVGDFNNFPMLNEAIHDYNSERIVKSCVKISKSDWNAFENSWNFMGSQLLQHIVEHEQPPPLICRNIKYNCAKKVPSTNKRYSRRKKWLVIENVENHGNMKFPTKI